MQLLDWQRLTEVAEFDPAYLQVANLGSRFRRDGASAIEPRPEEKPLVSPPMTLGNVSIRKKR